MPSCAVVVVLLRDELCSGIPRKGDMRKDKVEQLGDRIEDTLVPDVLKPIVEPPDRPYNPKGGRPSREPVDTLAKKLAHGREYYLTNAFNILLRNIAEELPCKCVENCPYEASCYLPEDERPRSRKINEGPGDAPRILRCPIEYDLIMTSFYGYLVELGIDYTRPTEVQTAAKLAGLQVYQRRIDCLLNEDGMVIEEAIPTRGGDVMLTHPKHPLWDVRKDLERREEAILKQFHATREQMERSRREEMASERKTVAQWLAGMRDEVVVEDV